MSVYCDFNQSGTKKGLTLRIVNQSEPEYIFLGEGQDVCKQLFSLDASETPDTNQIYKNVKNVFLC